MVAKEELKPQLPPLQTCILRVSMHCDGCKHKVKKLLRKLEGVYQVTMDADHQKVTVTGNVEPATLIKKLSRAGKHAELLSTNKNNQNQKQKGNSNDNNNNKGQKQVTVKKHENKNQQRVQRFEEDEEYFDDEDDELDEEEQIKLFREQFSQLGLLNQQVGLLKQQAMDLSNQNGAPGSINGGKKGNPNQNNIVMGGNPAAGLRMNNQNDINALMGLGIGNPNNPIGAFQVNPNPGFQNAGVMNNMNRHGMMMQQQPQMMYNMTSSAMAHPNSNYYYNYAPPHPAYNSGQSAASSNMYNNDDNTVGCSVM